MFLYITTNQGLKQNNSGEDIVERTLADTENEEVKAQPDHRLPRCR